MRTPADWLTGVRHPEGYHGRGVRRRFFEGWYIKLVAADRSARLAVIPGIFRGLEGGAADEAFVQVLDGLTGRSWFHSFPPEAFHAAPHRFDVRVGPNHFSDRGVELDLPGLRGRIEYTSALVPWPVTFREPGIMGWYGFVPALECFHGVVSFGHGLHGRLEFEERPLVFDGGRGYIEKDWGKAFPAGYVWLASNHIDTADGERPDASLVASVAIVPWLRGAFRGVIVGFHHGGRLHRWTTYRRARQTRLEIGDQHVHWTLTGPDGTLEIEAERMRGGLLRAPLRTAMHQRVEETLDASAHVRHTAPDGTVLLDGVASCAGLEVFGDIDRLAATPERFSRSR